MPIVSADARHGHPALPSALIPSITCKSRDLDASSFPLTHSSDYLITIYAYLFQSYLAITSDHHSHWSIHNGPPFLLSTFLFIPPISFQVHCLVPCTTSQYLSLPLTIFSYTASLLVMPPYAHSFPFLSFNFLSHSYWFYHYIFILTLTHLLSHWLNYSSSIVPSIPLVPTG
jgi:hypothetical protein